VVGSGVISAPGAADLGGAAALQAQASVRRTSLFDYWK